MFEIDVPQCLKIKQDPLPVSAPQVVFPCARLFIDVVVYVFFNIISIGFSGCCGIVLPVIVDLIYRIFDIGFFVFFDLVSNSNIDSSLINLFFIGFHHWNSIRV